MKQCFVCGHNIINSGFTNKMLEDKGNFLIIKDVPSLICANCGEVYLETEVMLKLPGGNSTGTKQMPDNEQGVATPCSDYVNLF